MSLLRVDSLSKNFGGLAAVSNVSLQLEQGELVGLIGPNGAGKTTLFNLLTGVYKPSDGQVYLEEDGQEQAITGLAPYKINQKGLARTFQNIRLFREMTVIENVLVAMDHEKGNSLFSTFLRSGSYYETEANLYQEAMKLLRIFDLDELAEDEAKNLAYGQQRRLEIVRALATKPKILFLDEPAAGMNHTETTELSELIAQIQEQFDLTIVLIEHDMNLVMEICERIYVLEYGRLIAHGNPSEIRNNPAVIKAYLGGGV